MDYEDRIKLLEEFCFTQNNQFQSKSFEGVSNELEREQLGIGKYLSPNSSALFAVSSVRKGIGFPVMTEEQRDAIPNPIAGLVIFNSTQGLLNQHDGIFWQSIGFALYTTTDRDALSANFGQTIFNTDTFTLDFYNGLQWVSLNGSTLPNYTTTERDALVLVDNGMMILNTTTNKINFYAASAWHAVTSV